MNRHFMGREWLSSQIQALNPIMIMLLIPVYLKIIYPAVERFVPLTPLRKIGAGLFMTVGSFLIIALIEARIMAGQTPNIAWQILAYFILTGAEVLVSITALEFSYTQAPRKLKSFIMSLFLMSVSLGNMVTAGVNVAIKNEDGSVALEGASYFLFFAGLMLIAAVVFIPFAMRFKEKTYVQESVEGAQA